MLHMIIRAMHLHSVVNALAYSSPTYWSSVQTRLFASLCPSLCSCCFVSDYKFHVCLHIPGQYSSTGAITSFVAHVQPPVKITHKGPDCCAFVRGDRCKHLFKSWHSSSSWTRIAAVRSRPGGGGETRPCDVT